MSKYFGIGLLVLAVALLVIFRNKLTALFTSKTNAPAAPAPQPTTPGNNGSAGLNMSLLLKKGVIAPEVGVLQGWVGATVDNNFGPQTEGKLFAKKGVKEVTLNQYATLPDAVTAADSADSNDGSWLDSLPYGYLFN